MEIFKTLGWEHVTAENILQLPLGDAVQKKTALDGLKSGEWGEFVQIEGNRYGFKSFFSVDKNKLVLYAIRVGVDAQRAVNLAYNTDRRLLIAVICERGVKYASEFIRYACISKRRSFEHSASVFGSVAVRLVDQLDLDIPQNVEYMKDWAVYAAAAMGFEAETRYREADLPELDIIKRRFPEHIVLGVATNTPATGPFGKVLPEGVRRGWLSRARGLELSFSALDASVRPGDRKVWMQVLDTLNVTDEELCDRMQSLIPIMSLGDSAVIGRLAPLFISHAEGELLCEVLLAAFSTTAKKLRQMVLKAALDRPCPSGADQLTPWLSMFAEDTDKHTAAAAEKLMEQWGLAAARLSEEKPEIQGLWRETPSVWSVPCFELGEVSPETLTDLAAQLVSQAAVIHDVTAERFLAMANAVARQDAAAARTSLRGLPRGDYSMLDFIVQWVKKESPVYGFDQDGKRNQPPLMARDYMVSRYLDTLPCILSTPSMVDLSITVPDLSARLSLYEKTGADVLEADLLLALTRLNVKTQTPKSIKALEKLNLPVQLQSGEKLSVTAGQAVLAYLKHPVKEPGLKPETGYWRAEEIEFGTFFPGFPNRFDGYTAELFSVFPLWGDYALRDVRWDSEVYHEKGLILRQVARRAAPLPPGASINILAAQRSTAPDAEEDSMHAVVEAWERGLLRPGAADVAWLDWNPGAPSSLAALANAFHGIILDGLLSVVWPILDALVGASLEAPRLLAGTAEIVELITLFVPEVQRAVEKGYTKSDSLDLPNLRALSGRGGTSRAVSAAQKALVLLPVRREQPPQPAAVPAVKVPFSQVWTTGKETPFPIEDGVAVSVDFVEPASSSSSNKLFLFTLTLPDRPDTVFRIIKSRWVYDLEYEGQCLAEVVSPNLTGYTEGAENKVWLHWDDEQKKMVAVEHRNFAEKLDGLDVLLPCAVAPELSLSLITVLIGLLAQDGDAKYFAPRLLKKQIDRGSIGAVAVRAAVRELLKSPVVSPAKLVRSLEADVDMLPVLWPILTESTKKAGEIILEGNVPPVWVNRILDTALRYAPYLTQAAELGLIPEEDAQWEGLSEIAGSKAKSTAVAKAKRLRAELQEELKEDLEDLEE